MDSRSSSLTRRDRLTTCATTTVAASTQSAVTTHSAVTWKRTARRALSLTMRRSARGAEYASPPFGSWWTASMTSRGSTPGARWAAMIVCTTPTSGCAPRNERGNTICGELSSRSVGASVTPTNVAVKGGTAGAAEVSKLAATWSWS